LEGDSCQCMPFEVAEKLGLRWILGGAAVYRGDNQRIFNPGFSRCAATSKPNRLNGLLKISRRLRG